jgi:hypothetical protein
MEGFEKKPKGKQKGQFVAKLTHVLSFLVKKGFFWGGLIL